MPACALANSLTLPIAPSIVHIVERMAPGGIETLVLDMVGGMAGQHTIFSLAGRRDALIAAWPRLAKLSCALEGFDRQLGVRPALIARITRRLRALKPDAVIVHHDGPMVYGGLAARLAGVHTVVHVEHDAWHYDSTKRRAMARVLFQVVRPRRVAVSAEIANQVAGYFGRPLPQVIAPGIDLTTFRPSDRDAARARLGLTAATPIIGTSGRLVAVKAQATLIEAVAMLRQSAADPATAASELVVVGEGPERAALEARAEAHGLASSVHLLGHRDDIADILPAFDVFALPSLHEGLPRAVLEAQAVGLGVVASAVGGLPDAVCLISGRLVPPSDPRALASALADLLAHPVDPLVPRRFVEQRFALSRTLAAFSSAIQPSGIAACGL